MEIPALGTVLCAVDLSDHSKAALYLAGGLANQPGANLVVLHVDASGGSAEMRAKLNALILQTLPGWLAYRDGTETILREGNTAHAILAAARETQARIIVMGTRRRGALSKALLGSTAADVLRESPVPVAVVPPHASEIGVARAVRGPGRISASSWYRSTSSRPRRRSLHGPRRCRPARSIGS